MGDNNKLSDCSKNRCVIFNMVNDDLPSCVSCAVDCAGSYPACMKYYN